MGIKTYLLMMSVILWGVLLGGITYSNLVYIPVYLSNLPDSAVVVNGQYGLNEGVFWLAIHPILVLTLIITLIANWKVKRRRTLILISLTVYIAILIITTLYFLPELGAFRNSPQSSVSAAEWLVRTRRWEFLSWIRGGIMFATIIPLLFALVRPELSDETY